MLTRPGPVRCLASALALLPGYGHATAPSSLSEFEDPGATMPVVLTAARLKQPQSEAPAAVTVLDRELIAASGVRNLVDVLRLVPGMQVGYESGHQQSVSYHGMADENSRRLQVLVNGRSVYQPFLARILWSDLPLALADVERIEVIRGPDSALYGANAFMAVINILTRHPADELGTRIQTTQGTRGVADYALSHAGTHGALDYRLSLGSQSDNGFDSRRDGSVHHDDREARYADLALDYALGESDSLQAGAGYKTGPNQISGFDAKERSAYHERDVDNGYLQLRWQHEAGPDHAWQVQAYYNASDSEEAWTTCQAGLLFSDELAALYDADPAYTLSFVDRLARGRNPPTPPAPLAAQAGAALNRAAQLGATVACGQVNQDLRETRSDLEFQDTWSANESLRLVSGFNLRRETATSETYLGGKESNDIARVFANAEWRFAPDWLMNLGATWEQDELVDNSFSPRLALNWHVTPHQTVRAILAQATRTPDLFEARANWTYIARGLSPAINPGRDAGRFFLRTTAPQDLDEERILSRELGYYLSLPKQALDFDLKLYDDELSELIEGNNNFGDFLIRSDGEARLRGAEFQLDWRPTPAWRLWLASAYIDMDELSLARNRVTAPELSASALGQYRFDSRLSLSASYYWMDKYLRADYEAVDLRLGYPLALGQGRELLLEAVAQTRLDEDYYYDSDNNYEADTGWYLRASLTF